MKSLADQIEEIGLAELPSFNRTDSRASGRANPPPKKDRTENLILELPLIGRVTRIEEDRGFGFISTGSGKDEFFFHLKGHAGRRTGAMDLPPANAAVIFIAGSDPRRKPSKEAVRWCPVSEVSAFAHERPANQIEFSALRRERLKSLGWAPLWRLLHADWYSKQWPNGAPANLDDDVLEEVWKARLGEIDAGEFADGTFWNRLSLCKYDFAAKLHSDHPQQTFDFSLFEPRQLASLGDPDASWMQKANDPLKARLMEWHLLRRCRAGSSGVGDDWGPWFQGTETFERDLAQKLLDETIETNGFVKDWLARLTANGLLLPTEIEQWVERHPATALALFEYLPQERRTGCLAAWRAAPEDLAALKPSASQLTDILSSEALSVDLETDGESIWEIGCAKANLARQLYDRGSDDELSTALSDLHGQIRSAPLVIGHNFLAWDWPIIARHTSSEFTPLVWDTLLVQFLLNPQAPTHALGSNHHAKDDALAARELFEKQLSMLDPEIACSVLTGKFRDTGQLLEAISKALQGKSDYACEMPPVISEAVDPDELLILPKERLREFDWIPNVSVVSADPNEGLPFESREIDAEAFERIAEEGLNRPAAQVALAVVRMAAEQGIFIRRNMIPFWLLEGNTALTEALDRCAVVPQRKDGWRVAPMPLRPDWWRDADLDALRLAARDQQSFITYREKTAFDVARPSLPDWQSASLTRLKSQDGITDWVKTDRAAHVLERNGGLRTFTTWQLPKGLKRLPTTASSDVSVQIVLATRRHHVLHPGAFDQLGYWTEVLRSFREIARQENRATPLLLIGSSESPELVKMLEVALAELGMGEVRPDHRSKREHLLRATRRGYAVVDLLTNWRDWHEKAESAEVSLKPVVEAVPLEEWYAYSRQIGMQTHASETSDQSIAPPETSIEPQTIGSGAILEAMPSLVSQHLPAWLTNNKLSNVREPVTLIDPRLSGIAHELKLLVDTVPLRESALTADEIERLNIALSPFKLTRDEAPTDFASMERFFVENWNPKNGEPKQIEGFKASQRSAMEAICDRASNVLISLPTGEGKSVLFQVPALCRGLRSRRLTLVISPLKALMRDQVEGLRDLGFAESVDFLSGDRPKHEIDEVMQGVLDHRIVLLYVAPERLRSAVFLDVLDKRMISDEGLDHVVIDEAHCVNQWGFEFRPDYFYATEFLLRQCSATTGDEPTPFLLLSATITASDKERLEAILSGVPDENRMPMLVRPENFAHPIRSHISILPHRVRGRVGGDDLERALAERLPVIEKAIADAAQNHVDTGQRSAVIVFVPSRRLAEELARRFSDGSGVNAEFYHAGMDAATKEEVYADFRDGELDVLVATKAFGMGMDIPDIHWVVHLSPPSYLEDYLQEVGRIGRGQEERERAKLKNLSALLPFSNEDFEHIRDLRAQNTLQRQDIDDVFSEIRENAYEVDGQLLAVVPAEGYKPLETETERRAAATRLRMAIYWLERAGRLALFGSLADVLTIGLSPEILKKITEEEGPLAELADLLLHLENAETYNSRKGASQNGASIKKDTTGLLGRLLHNLADIVGLVFNGSAKRAVSQAPTIIPRQSPNRPTANSSQPDIGDQSGQTAVINLSQIRFQLRSMKSNDDVFAGLLDLEKRGGVSLNREIEFSLRRLASEHEDDIRILFGFIDDAAKQLLGRLAETGNVEFHPSELVDIEPFIFNVALKAADQPEKQDQEDKTGTLSGANEEDIRRRRRMFERAFINGFRTLVRSSGVHLRQITSADDTVLWEATLASSKNRIVDQRRRALVQAAQSVFGILKRSEKRIAVSKLVDQVRQASVGRKFRELDLKKTAGLLAAMNLIGMTVDLVQFSHVLLLRENSDADESSWDELSEINDFSEARSLAMEVFANVRTDAQEAFITGYFSQSDANGLKGFLETQLGEIEEPSEGGDAQGASSIIAQMQEKLRATKAIEFFEKFKTSEESAQWEAVRHPFDHHLLVNAGPGAGKTFVLVGRIVHLIREQHIHPSQIVVLAFNRAVVFEIKRRVRDLFRSLGYAAYASRLRVSTIHSFAMRHLARDGWQGEDSTMDGALSEFARRMRNDHQFRSAVAGDVRCILVDEFQDLTDEVYDILCALHEGSDSRAGIMVIGDDDQDILRWQRSGGNFSEIYFDRFAHDFGGDRLRQLLLSVNFRSGEEVVRKSQAMISTFFERSNRSKRLKNSTLITRQDAPTDSACKRLDWRGKSLGDAVIETLNIWKQAGEGAGGSFAILCRSNAEVAEVHRLLEPHISGVSVQGAADLRVANLRHVGLWLDFLRTELAGTDRALTEQLAEEFIGNFVRNLHVPEGEPSSDEMVSLENLWDLCTQEQAFPHISSLIRFVEDLRSDDLGRLLGVTSASSPVVVSTIHKVKGLEFDNVVIFPSNLSFGGKGYNKSSDLEGDAAEEARLLYVAMTRAKRNLWQFVGDREYSWAKGSPALFKGQQTEGCVLIGSPEDVGLGWAAQRNWFNDDPDKTQAYIESEVKVGDAILLGGCGEGAYKALFHRNASGEVRQVGFLANKHGAGNRHADLKVSAVIRFYPKETTDANLAPVVVERGWGYVVLVSGRIR
ncbi:UvrD-helicase domain-containing protein [Qipengyuania citrea]|uniref:UvrD-helicase domain-containing protein n=1 Tax=Qipengyuania citrea TaxID=225971 RepID=UPI00329733A4